MYCILAPLNIPGCAVWLTLKLLDASRRNKCVCNCRWRKENTKQLAATMHADYCHMLLIYEQCLLWQRCLIFIVFELPISWSRSWLTYSMKKPFKILKLNAVICYGVILHDYKCPPGGISLALNNFLYLLQLSRCRRMCFIGTFIYCICAKIYAFCPYTFI